VESWIRDVVLPAAMLGLMFGMGLALTIADFRRIATAPLATLVGTSLQLVGMPLVGIALAVAYDLPPLLAAGLVVIAACPGGMFSNVYVHFAGANTALSITLTATATMVTLFTLPLWVRAILAIVGGEGSDLEVPVLETALELGTLTVLPVMVGMAVRSRRPSLAGLERWLAPACALLIFGGMVIDGLQRPDLPLEAARLSLLPVIWLGLAAVALGLAVPMMFRLPMGDCATIGVEIVVKNVLLGLVLANRSLGFEAAIPILVFSVAQTPAGVLILVAWRLLARRGLADPPLPRREA